VLSRNAVLVADVIRTRETLHVTPTLIFRDLVNPRPSYTSTTQDPAFAPRYRTEERCDAENGRLIGRRTAVFDRRHSTVGPSHWDKGMTIARDGLTVQTSLMIYSIWEHDA
ncbi:hypothetical protein BaRGS_00035427, partial [Batillaria attramentaria]